MTLLSVCDGNLQLYHFFQKMQRLADAFSQPILSTQSGRSLSLPLSVLSFGQKENPETLALQELPGGAGNVTRTHDLLITN